MVKAKLSTVSAEGTNYEYMSMYEHAPNSLGP